MCGIEGDAVELVAENAVGGVGLGAGEEGVGGGEAFFAQVD